MNIIEVSKGSNIYSAIEEAQKEFLRAGNYKEGKLRFNGILVPFSVDSNITDIVIIYNLMSELRRLNH